MFVGFFPIKSKWKSKTTMYYSLFFQKHLKMYLNTSYKCSFLAIFLWARPFKYEYIEGELRPFSGDSNVDLILCYEALQNYFYNEVYLP